MVSASLIVPSRGGAQRLPVLVDHLERQTLTDFEVVIVLDGDVDGSAEVLRSLGRPLPVRVITFAENRGRCAALNAGFDAARGDILVRCDDDLAPRADYVEGHVSAHRRGPVGVVGLYVNVLPRTPYAEVYGDLASTRFVTDAYACPPEQQWRYWAGNASVSRDTWLEVGRYDGRTFRSYGWEDVDYGYRLHLAGVPVVLDQGLETPHHIAATTTEGRCLRALYSGAGRARFEQKHPEASLPPANAERTPWDALVRTAARHLSEESVQRIGRRLDVALPRVPGPIGTKMISLLVEAAALAGHARPEAIGHAI